MSLNWFALSCIGLRCCLHVALAAHLSGFCSRESAPCWTWGKRFPPFWGPDRARFLEGVGKLLFWGAPSGVQTPSEAGYPSTFYEEFNDPVWSSFWGAPLGVLPRTQDRIFHEAFVACLHWSAIVCIRQHKSYPSQHQAA